MDYSETLQYLFSRLPMFSAQGKSAIKPGLENTVRLCSLLGDPQHKFHSVHIAGTNGKGSTSHMLAAILQTAGYRTGLYTSPHLKDFRERIRINGKMIAEFEVTDFISKYRKTIEEINPSFFEVTVAMAFDYFAANDVDIAVVEVGLGGRLDSTNVIEPLLSIITNIHYDHIDILGNTLPLIAAEKAGIIKPGVSVIIGQRQEEVASVFIDKAADAGSPLIFASDNWHISKSDSRGAGEGCLSLNIIQLNHIKNSGFDIENLLLDLTGSYQLKNLPAVLTAVAELRKSGWIISDQHIQKALSQVKALTGLMGRWQVLNTKPLIICDTGHNEDGIREVVRNIEACTFDNLHIVIGMVKDKDVSTILKLLPEKATYYFCEPNLARAKPVLELQYEASAHGLKGLTYPGVKAALDAAKDASTPGDLIFVGGSTFVVAEII